MTRAKMGVGVKHRALNKMLVEYVRIEEDFATGFDA